MAALEFTFSVCFRPEPAAQTFRVRMAATDPLRSLDNDGSDCLSMLESRYPFRPKAYERDQKDDTVKLCFSE